MHQISAQDQGGGRGGGAALLLLGFNLTKALGFVYFTTKCTKKTNKLSCIMHSWHDTSGKGYLKSDRPSF